MILSPRIATDNKLAVILTKCQACSLRILGQHVPSLQPAANLLHPQWKLQEVGKESGCCGLNHKFWDDALVMWFQSQESTDQETNEQPTFSNH